MSSCHVQSLHPLSIQCRSSRHRVATTSSPPCLRCSKVCACVVTTCGPHTTGRRAQRVGDHLRCVAGAQPDHRHPHVERPGAWTRQPAVRHQDPDGVGRASWGCAWLMCMCSNVLGGFRCIPCNKAAQPGTTLEDRNAFLFRLEEGGVWSPEIARPTEGSKEQVGMRMGGWRG